MTRPAVLQRLLALILAGGSFPAWMAGAVHAQGAPASTAPAQEPASSAPAQVPAGLARLNIAPLRLEFDAGKQTATVILTNTSDRQLAVQNRLFAWSQQAGEDRFAPSNALTISPSIISIPPGATQFIRLLRVEPASPGEKRFRLAVDQLPDPTMVRNGQAEARLRFTVPVFLDRDKAPPANLAWRLSANGLEVSNAGNATARIVSVEAKSANGNIVPLGRNSLRYVIGGSTISWPIANACALGTVTVTAQVDGKATNVQAGPACS